MNSIPCHGLQDIRTMTERINDADNPQRKYLALAMLELERVRLDKNKRSAAQRVVIINQRLAAITAEQTNLLADAKIELGISTSTERRGRAANMNSQSKRGFALAY